MAKQLLGKEVTAALNERIKANVAALKEKGMGGAQPNISRELLVNYYFSLPPLNEQHRIVEKIKSIFSQLDTMQEIFLQ